MSKLIKRPALVRAHDDDARGLPKEDSQRFSMDAARADLKAELERMKQAASEVQALGERATVLLRRCAGR